MVAKTDNLPPPLLSSPQLLTESETEAVFVSLSGAQESIPNLPDRYENPIVLQARRAT